MRVFDIVIIGAATTGAYFGKLMAEKGFSTLVIDSIEEKDIGTRLSCIHLDRKYFEESEIPAPMLGDNDYLTSYEYNMNESAYGHYPIKTNYPYIVMRLDKFSKRLRDWARKVDCNFDFETKFIEFIFDARKKICGIRVEKEGTIEEIYCKLVVDCTGIAGYARCKLPDWYGIENTPLNPEDILFANVEYFRLKRPERDKLSYSTIYPYYKVWFGPVGEDDTAQFGACGFGSYDNAIASGEEFKKTVYLPPHDVDKIEQGMMPYRYSLYSFVADGFLCLGDSAAISKPYSGEGITATWNLCKIAAIYVANAMKDGKYPTREALWPINTKYSRGQGADFAELLALTKGALNCSKDENELEFKYGFGYEEGILSSMSINFANKLTPIQKITQFWKIVVILYFNRLTSKTIKDSFKGYVIGKKAKKLYKKYPKKPKHFDKWCAKANKLWAKYKTI